MRDISPFLYKFYFLIVSQLLSCLKEKERKKKERERSTVLISNVPTDPAMAAQDEEVYAIRSRSHKEQSAEGATRREFQCSEGAGHPLCMQIYKIQPKKSGGKR